MMSHILLVCSGSVVGVRLVCEKIVLDARDRGQTEPILGITLHAVPRADLTM